MKRVSVLIVALGVFVAGCGSSLDLADDADQSDVHGDPVAGERESGDRRRRSFGQRRRDRDAGRHQGRRRQRDGRDGNVRGESLRVPRRTRRSTSRTFTRAQAGVNGGIVMNSGITAGQNVLTNGSRHRSRQRT